MFFPSKPVTHTIILLFLLIFMVEISLGQKINADDNKFYIALSPLGLIDYKDGSSIRISTDIKIYQNFSISNESIIYTSAGNFFSYKINPRGFAIKTCFKFYLNDNKFTKGVYIGIEYLYKPQIYLLHDSISVNSTTQYFKEYRMTRYINCITIKAGELINLNKKILFEWFGGIGIRFFNSFTSLTSQDYNGIVRGETHYNSTGGGYQARVIGKKVFPNFSVGIKIGYSVK